MAGRGINITLGLDTTTWQPDNLTTWQPDNRTTWKSDSPGGKWVILRMDNCQSGCLSAVKVESRGEKMTAAEATLTPKSDLGAGPSCKSTASQHFASWHVSRHYSWLFQTLIMLTHQPRLPLISYKMWDDFLRNVSCLGSLQLKFNNDQTPM